MEFDYEQMLDEALSKVPEKSEYVSRFKMPVFKSSEQGNKTIIHNFIEIVETLMRDPKHLSKYIYKELAMAGNIQGNQLVLYGHKNNEDLQKMLENYVNEFVLCKSCKNPDTKLSTEGRIDYMSCEACGSKMAIRSL
ncbi:MAG TPA: translation initiation factor IF-2 subunit beta [archaeon]|nr:translation initiation factor IF-2 subunit beta [archaeon]